MSRRLIGACFGISRRFKVAGFDVYNNCFGSRRTNINKKNSYDSVSVVHVQCKQRQLHLHPDQKDQNYCEGNYNWSVSKLEVEVESVDVCITAEGMVEQKKQIQSLLVSNTLSGTTYTTSALV